MSNNEIHDTTVRVMNTLGLTPDPWQIDVITGDHKRLLLNCSRQAGKTSVVAIMGLVEALTRPMTRILLLSRSLRQSREMFRLMTYYHQRLGSLSLERQTCEELELKNESRIVCMPCREDTIRGFAHVDLLVIDEAARVPDDLYRTVRPMMAVSDGRLIALSTPFGKRGWFHDAWARGGDDWARIQITAEQCPRITPKFLDQERRALGESWFRQEYFCSFETVEGVVYPDFARCVVPYLPSPSGRGAGGEGELVGGIDFGFRNPFAAVWGFLDNDDVLWLTGEHYARQRPLSYHVQHLPRKCTWYADPSGANEISELILGGFVVRRGINDRRTGIAAVSARLEDGRLKVLEGRCPNLLMEAGMYRWGESEDRRAEVPVDEHNHALAALRYLIATTDRHSLGRRRIDAAAHAKEMHKTPEQLAEEERNRRYWEMAESDDPRIWGVFG
ncbi:MAG: hypothetical protein HYX68_01410 [Planctomycetes bacterium]|nr:hypothetical protein [Planctomycetota bacterium]